MAYETTTADGGASRTETKTQAGRAPSTEEKHDAPKAARNIDEAAHDLVDYVSDKAHHAGDAIKKSGGNIAKRARGAHSCVTSFARDYPTAAVLISFGIGVTVARMLPHR